MIDGEVLGAAFRVQYGEIAEQYQFRIGRVGSEAWEAYFPIAALADVTAVLSAAPALSVKGFARGTSYQTHKLEDWQQSVAIEPLSYTPTPALMQVYSAEVPELVSLLGQLASALPTLDPGDWDDSKPKPDTRAVSQSQLPAYLQPASLEGTYGASVLPMQFGAVGDGVTNDSAALNAAYDYLASIGGGTLVIPRGYRFKITDGIDMDTPGVSIIHQGGWLVGGSIRVGKTTGTDSAVSFAGTKIDILYDGQDARGTRNALVMKRARELTISGTYKNVNAVVSATTAGGASGFHTLGQIRLDGIRASDHNFVVYVATATWDVCSDWQVNDLYSNRARLTTLHFAGGIDGLSIRNGVWFFAGYNTGGIFPWMEDKLHHVYIEKANWVSSIGVKYWESGHSCWKLDDIQELTLVGNEFAWSGETQLSDVIEINGGNIGGYIGGNEINQWTRAAIGIYGGDSSRLTIGENDFQENLSHASNITGTTLTTATTSRVFVDTDVTAEPSIRFFTPVLPVYDSIKGRSNVRSVDRKSLWGGVSGFNRGPRTATEVAAGIGLLRDPAGAATYDGLLVVQARNGPLASALTAVYILAVSSSGPNCVEVAATGYVAGAAANQPSFTWSIVSDGLRGTAKGSTAGSGFWFDVTCIGAVKLY